MNNSQKIRFAVVGCGHIGKRHAEMVKREEGAELVALCDIRPQEELGIENYPVPFFSNMSDLLQAGLDLDVINICVPNGLHAQLAIQALETGHHVVIEKPMALTLADAEKVVYTSLKYRKQVFCVMQNRYSPPSVWIKEMVESGRLGKIYMVQLNCYWNRDDRYYNPGGWHGDAQLDGGNSPISSTSCIGYLVTSVTFKPALPTLTTSIQRPSKTPVLSISVSSMEEWDASTIRQLYGTRTWRAVC